MKTVIIACRTLEDELNYAMKRVGVAYQVEWIESGLHNTPKKLTARLQELLDSVEADRVLLAMGYCGNSIMGIVPKNYYLIIPRVDDCISLLIGSINERAKVSKQYAAYFLTEGWMRGERNLWVEYQYSVEKYGEEQARSIAEMMYGHYRTLGLLDTGVKPIEPLIQSTRFISEALKLEQKVIPATVTYIEHLLIGPWNKDKFIIKAPGEEITAVDLNYNDYF